MVERFAVASGEAAEATKLESVSVSPTFDIDGFEDGVITRDRDVKDSAVTFFGTVD